MASPSATKRMRDEATCSICLNLMVQPLSIGCGHSYCRACITGFLRSMRRAPPGLDTIPCPQCRAPFQASSLRPNQQLGNLIEAFKELGDVLLCKDHGEQLHLFCEEDDELICWRCERAPAHRGHTTALLEEVGPGYKEQLEKALTHLHRLEEERASHVARVTSHIGEWNGQVQLRRQRIQSAFQDLHSFLREQEASQLWRLEQEAAQTLRGLWASQLPLGDQGLELEAHSQELQQRCQGSAQRLLQGVKDALRRSWAIKLQEPEAPSLEVRTECDVSQLYFDVKKWLRGYQVSVTLDPDTAHPELILSEDQRQVTRGCPQENLDAAAGRFTASPCVLGRQGFASGRHYFEVDVGEGTGWDVGVCLEDVPRGPGLVQQPQSGFWAIRLCADEGYVALTSPPTPLHLQEPPLLVGVFLDFDAGAVSFYSMPAASHVFTFPRGSLSGLLRPYFQVHHYSPLFLPSPGE